MHEYFNLTGKTAIVTGASSGLGKRFAEVLSKFGAKVIIIARRKERLKELAKTLNSKGGFVIPLDLDIEDDSLLQKKFSSLLESGEKIDILVNSAGVLRLTPAFSESIESFDKIFNVNVRSLWIITQKIACHMRDENIQGSIINVASISGDLVPSYKEGAYCASKAAVNQITKQLVGEFSPYNIRINSILPGLIRTEMTQKQIEQDEENLKKEIPLGFIAEPKDLDCALLYLASNKASRYVTGSSLIIDGGDSWRGV